jgi:iron complex outermembrane recepter protein
MTGFDAARQLGLGLLVTSLLFAAPATAQDATDAAADAAADTAAEAAPDTTADTAVVEEVLPEVDVIQDTPKQRRAKKKRVQASPLSKAASTPAPATAAASVPASSTAGEAADADPVGEEIDAIAPVTLPSAVTTATEQDVKREGTKRVQKVLEKQVPSVTLSDAAGSPARAELQFRGFDSSPVTGRGQGLAVYQNGIRINEAFGDTVNWSFVPTNAIEAISIVSNNPVFGLNALGGAASIILKDGFSFQGVELDVMGGSFGRIQTGLQLGASSGNAAVYAALEGVWEDGFRDFSDTEIKRFYGDIGLRGSKAEVHLSLTAAQNDFGATAAAPVELLARDYSNTFTSPQTTDLEMFMPSISGTLKATDTMTLSGVAYYRRYKNSVVDGNVTESGLCEAGSEGAADGAVVGQDLCGDEGEGDALLTLGGAFINGTAFDPLGSIERLNTESRGWGGAFELQEQAKLFNRPNQFIFGVSYDKGETNYQTASELGVIGPKFVVSGTGIIVTDEEGEVSPRNLNSTNTYWGIYFSNAFDVTDQLTVTVGGRYNHATIKLEDLTGDFPGLNATNTYERFNPQVGANYKITRGLSVYGGYSESNRAPTPAELGCAEPDNPCLLETFLTDDPPLDQVVGRSAEIGLRGQGYMGRGQFSWGAGLFRTLAEDDILPVVSPTGRVFFTNGGDTLRQGIELYAAYGIQKNWNIYTSYAFIDATLDKCTNPDAEGECAFLREGDRLAGIPRHLFKAGFEYWLTPKWKLGADLIASGDRPFFRNDVARDEGRFDSLAGFTRVDLHTSYDVTENIQVYGFVKNLFNQRYGLYGTYFEADEVGEVDEDLGGPGFADPRTISPSQPFAAYGGIRIKY